MFWKKRKSKATDVPQNKDIKEVRPYYLKYNGQTGFAQVMSRIETKFVAIEVNNPSGKVNRIMEVTEREYFSDFGGTCTGLKFKATGFVFNS